MAGAAARPRVGLAGCGRWGAHILRDLLHLGAEVIVADPSDAARRSAQAAGAGAAVATAEELPLVAGAIVAAPTRRHAALLDALLPRRVPLFCEKPLTADAASAERLAAAAGDRLFVMDKWRYHPGVEALRRIAVSGELGAVEGLRTTRIGWDAPHPDVDAIWILTPHDLSIGLEVLGTIPTPRSAVAELVDGGAAGLGAVLGTSPWLTLEVSVARRERRRELHLVCRDGAATLPDAYADHLRIERFGADGAPRSIEQRPFTGDPPLHRELRAFLDHLAGGPPPRSSAAEGAAIVRTIERLRELAGIATV